MCGADNGLGRPSKASGIRFVPKYCKIRNGPFCGLFCRKDGNIGLLRGKVPRFCPKSTDVCPWEVRCFSTEARRKSGVFSCFSGVFALFSAICSVLMSRNRGRKGLKVCENDRSNAENRSGTGGGPCQNISRCLCFFYILRKAFWGAKAWSVQSLRGMVLRMVCRSMASCDEYRVLGTFLPHLRGNAPSFISGSVSWHALPPAFIVWLPENGCPLRLLLLW